MLFRISSEDALCNLVTYKRASAGYNTYKRTDETQGEKHMLFGKQTGCANLSMDKAQMELENDKSIKLIDVRTPEEYHAGHIPGSRNIPLDRIGEIEKTVPDRDAKLFVYCLSGGRSASACAYLVRLGYTNVTNIGGIARWNGRIETAQAVRS
jgi:rhodanese-related sulfurtransferase